MDNSNLSPVLESDCWQSLENTEKKLKIAIQTLKVIAIWNNGLQKKIEDHDLGISYWRGCVAQANIALEEINKV